MINRISLRHTKTTIFRELNELDRLDIYDSNLEYLDNIMKYYLDLQDGIDELDNIREDYYLLLINISKIYKLINKSIYYLNKWFELDNKLYREVLLIDNNRGYFINDLITLYKDDYYSFNNKLNKLILLVIQNKNTGVCTKGLEIKLTALPDNSTCNLTDNEYSCELVIRPDTISYLACSIVQHYSKSKVKLAKLMPDFSKIRDWSNEKE